jgi:L-asparaginase
MTPGNMWELHLLVKRLLRRKDVTGVVITHGTDTLEETAFFLDLQHTSEKPVVFVGAMRNASLPSYDGPANIRAALRTAVAAPSRSRGVLVVLSQMIHAASAAVKQDTQALDTFVSPVFGPIGMVEADRVIFSRQLDHRHVLAAPRFEDRVALFLMHSGADGRPIEHALNDGAQGIVIEGTGNGNAPPGTVPAIQKALDRKIPVLMSTRCGQGRVLDTYAYPGSGRDLRKRGVMLAGFLNGQKARVLLMLALGKTRDPRRLRKYVEAGQYD